MSATYEQPRVLGGWKFWIAEDGAVCIENEDGDVGNAFRWDAFEDMVKMLREARTHVR